MFIPVALSPQSVFGLDTRPNKAMEYPCLSVICKPMKELLQFIPQQDKFSHLSIRPIHYRNRHCMHKRGSVTTSTRAFGLSAESCTSSHRYASCYTPSKPHAHPTLRPEFQQDGCQDDPDLSKHWCVPLRLPLPLTATAPLRGRPTVAHPASVPTGSSIPDPLVLSPTCVP